MKASMSLYKRERNESTVMPAKRLYFLVMLHKATVTLYKFFFFIFFFYTQTVCKTKICSLCGLLQNLVKYIIHCGTLLSVLTLFNFCPHLYYFFNSPLATFLTCSYLPKLLL